MALLRTVLALPLLLAVATAAYAQGWYLMVPPLEGGQVKRDAPLSAWTQVQAFDAVSQCEESRTLWIRFVLAKGAAALM